MMRTFFVLAQVLLLVGTVSAQERQLSADLNETEKFGRKIFQTRCSMCHVGQDPATEFADGTPEPWTFGPLLSKAQTADEGALRGIIKDGSRRMPGYKYALNDAQIDQVIAFMKTIDQPLQVLSMPRTVRSVDDNATEGLLTGTITSEDGQPIEGIAVSARVGNETITVSVYTGADGQYFFPAMKSATYTVWAQAIGLERAEATATLGSEQHLDFTMKETTDIIPQLSGYQVIAALPDDTVAHRRGKALFQKNCTYCHETSTALRDRFDQNGWEAIISVMLNGFSPSNNKPLTPIQKELATYLTEMRGPGPSPMTPTVSRPTGEATLPVIYDYDVEFDGGGYSAHNGSDWRFGSASSAGGTGSIHDSTIDFNGNIWFTSTRSSTERTVGKVDTTTGKTTSFAVPLGTEGEKVASSHGILLSEDGRVYFNASPVIPYLDGTLGRIDPNTEIVESLEPPEGMTRVSGWLSTDAQGNIWAASGSFQAGAALRFDQRTKTFTEFKSPTAGLTYGIAGDRDGNAWWMAVNDDIISYSNGLSAEVSEIKLPQRPLTEYMQPGDLADGEELPSMGLGGRQAPRRPSADLSNDSVWIPNFYGNTLLHIDTRTKALTYHDVPFPGMNPYEAMIDSQSKVWLSFQNSDQVGRFDPDTETWTMYSWPKKGMGQRQNHILERDGVIQLSSASGIAHSVGSMVMRSAKDIEALRNKVR
tara:strand:+ start:445 stop:2559 length:2115 start_codon:yes stop_codon:yes gene_type:complete